MTTPKPPGATVVGAPPKGTAGSFVLNGKPVSVNAKGIITTKGPWYGKYPAQVDDPVGAQVRSMFGDVAAFLNHPELGPILRKAGELGWDESRLFGALQQTRFWRTEGDQSRKWQIQSVLDPATAKAQVAQQQQAVSDFARSSGLNLPPDVLAKFATDSLKNGWSQPQIREQLFAYASNRKRDPNGLAGAVGVNYGYLAAFLDEPEVGDILRRGARNGWTEQQLEQALQGTSWWKTTTDASRKWMAQQEQNPGEAQATLATRVSEAQTLARSLGVNISEAKLSEIAESSLKLGWGQPQLRSAITAQYEYGDENDTGQGRRGPGGPRGRAVAGAEQDASGGPGGEFGFAAETIRGVKEMAGQYLVPVSDAMLEKWTEQIVRGETDMNGFNAYVVEQAKSLFPGMAGALDKGVTVAQYADPYKQIAARELEIAPESIDLNDPRYRKMLDQTDAKGNRVSMTLSESAEYLRKLPEWQQTRGANEKAASLTENILKTFGAVS